MKTLFRLFQCIYVALDVFHKGTAMVEPFPFIFFYSICGSGSPFSKLTTMKRSILQDNISHCDNTSLHTTYLILLTYIFKITYFILITHIFIHILFITHLFIITYHFSYTSLLNNISCFKNASFHILITNICKITYLIWITHDSISYFNKESLH